MIFQKEIVSLYKEMNFLYRLINTTSFADEKDKKKKFSPPTMRALCNLFIITIPSFFNF